jgi:hypothetical protein
MVDSLRVVLGDRGRPATFMGNTAIRRSDWHPGYPHHLDADLLPTTSARCSVERREQGATSFVDGCV